MSVAEDYFGPPSLEEVRPLTRSFAAGREWEISEFLELLNYAQSIEASDLHLKSGAIPRIRSVQGVLPPDKPEFREPVLGASLSQFISYLERLTTATDAGTPDHSLGLVDVHGYHNFSVKIAHSSMRVGAYRETSGKGLAIRFFYNRHMSLEYLAIPELVSVLEKPHGLFLATGPNGSGKTTTLAAMVNHLNEREAIHIATLEDPVEYIYTDKRARITQRNVPAHIASYEEGFASVMRQDPDVMVIGELQSLEMMRQALLAAEAGHLVMATMHASSVAHAIYRYVSLFSPTEQSIIRQILADTLIGISNQKLLPTPHGKWALAIELMTMNPMTATLIREGNYEALEDIEKTNSGMISWDQRLDTLLTTGLLSEDLWLKYRRDHSRPNPLHAESTAVMA